MYQSLKLLSGTFKIISICGVIGLLIWVTSRILASREVLSTIPDYTLQTVWELFRLDLVILILGMFGCLMSFAFGTFIMLIIDIEEGIRNIDSWFKKRDAEASTRALKAAMNPKPNSQTAVATPTSSPPKIERPRQPIRTETPPPPSSVRPTPPSRKNGGYD